MRFSLAMPSRNMGRYIERAVRSVLEQSWSDLELLVQDASSTDETLAALARIDDPRLTVVSEPDGGQADAINRALARAGGDVLGWLNADDELEPGALGRVAETLRRNPDAELVYGRGEYIDAQGTVERPYDVRPFDRRLLLTRDFILQPAAFWRRNLWDRTGPLDTTLDWAFDWEWFIRASDGGSFLFLDEPLARYRLTGENKSLTGGDRRQAELAAVARRHGGRLQPTYLYWRFTRVKRRLPFVAPLEPLLWRLFPGRIMA